MGEVEAAAPGLVFTALALLEAGDVDEARRPEFLKLAM
jgi:hypothetical protein